ncbi:putative membrane mmpL11 domain protein [Mycobacterium kansasii]|uniref:Putative membrane mmpL11 domain protein n=1 Tax=Mycobacterium kansasii TaxID=1768 RepID=A0A1V3WSU6_MYCKA|nr:putative membrane mmpL11 domain protein [Mycobacterium kansasii]
MMRLSRNLRRFRWLVFTGWFLALVPAIYLAMTQSGNLTGGGFEVAGSQSLLVHDVLDAQYPDQEAPSLALVATPRPDASFQDINDAVARLRSIAGEFPGVSEVPNPTQRPRSPTGHMWCRCGWTPATPAPAISPRSCARRSA